MKYTPRQIEIIRAAVKLIGTKGIQNLTTKNLAEEVGFTEPALYRHFKTKNEILTSLLLFFGDEMKVGFVKILNSKRNGKDKIMDLVKFQFAIFKSNPALLMVVFSETCFQYNEILAEKVAELVNNKRKLIKKMIEIGQSDKSIIADLQSSQLVDVVMGSMRFSVLKWRISKFEFDLESEGVKLCKTLERLIADK